MYNMFKSNDNSTRAFCFLKGDLTTVVPLLAACTTKTCLIKATQGVFVDACIAQLPAVGLRR